MTSLVNIIGCDAKFAVGRVNSCPRRPLWSTFSRISCYTPVRHCQTLHLLNAHFTLDIHDNRWLSANINFTILFIHTSLFTQPFLQCSSSIGVLPHCFRSTNYCSLHGFHLVIYRRPSAESVSQTQWTTVWIWWFHTDLHRWLENWGGGWRCSRPSTPREQ